MRYIQTFRRGILMRRWVTVMSILCLSACATAPYDYTNFRQKRPKSVLVLPPLSESTEVLAPYSYLSTITRPLAERGYYVFPVALVDQMMKENGLPTPGEMHQASLKKIAEVIRPDAVLYITLKQYGSSYQVVSSETRVTIEARLVDTRSGDTIWAGNATSTKSYQDSSGNLLGMLIGAAIAQAVKSESDEAHQIAPYANNILLSTPDHGLLFGPYHPQYKTD